MKQNGRTRQLNKCLRKKRYRSLAEARRWARYRTNSRGVVHTAYECKICFWFHLTSGGYVGQGEEAQHVRKR